MTAIVVTGLGIISSIGNSAEENRESLIKSRAGISKNNNFYSRYSTLLPFGEIKKSTAQLMEELNANEKGVTRTSLLALHSIQEAIEDSKLTLNHISSSDTALIGASTVGGMCLTDQLFIDATTASEGSEYLSSYDCASVMLFLQNRYKMKGIVNTINTACSSSSNAIMYGARLIKSGLVKRAIVGGSDSLSKFSINGFNALHILSSDICRPFDANRSGLNLGEGAAFLILEKEEDCKDKKVYAKLSGYANTNDSFHSSSLSEDGQGPFLAMTQALESASLDASSISFINAHGTATENNDEVESVAMRRIFEKVPEFASTKSYTGHTLGAAGAIEAVFSIFNIVNQEVYSSLNYTSPIEKTGLVPNLNYCKTFVQHVMSNSFGFGGNCSSLIFSKH